MQNDDLSRIRERANEDAKRLAGRLAAGLDFGLCTDPVELRRENLGGERARYGFVGPKLAASVERLRHVAPQQVANYLRYVAVILAAQYDWDCLGCSVPEAIRKVTSHELGRILDRASEESDYFGDLSNDSVRKDLAILGGRLIPVGAGVAAPNGGVPRSTAFRDGVAQAFGFLRFRINSGALRPWLEMHTHLDSLSEFSEDGWNRSYRRVADLLVANPEWRGVFRASWFLDPALKRISPKLSYLSEVPLANGAEMFFVEVNKSGNCGALHRSETRRKLFLRGEYVPRIYLMAWPRCALIAWSRTSGSEQARRSSS
jgi:hypothetical protein